MTYKSTTAQVRTMLDEIYEWAKQREAFVTSEVVALFPSTSRGAIWSYINALRRSSRVERIGQNPDKSVSYRAILDPSQHAKEARWVVPLVEINVESVADIIRRYGDRDSVGITGLINAVSNSVNNLAEVRRVLFDNPQAFVCIRDEWRLRQ